MAILKSLSKKIILIIITISILLTFFASSSVYAAKLDIKEGEFYYPGTTKGTYTVSEGIFSWLLNSIADIADWLIGIMTMGFRMVFVGWTALIEKLLTWALESTTGYNLDGELVSSSTDLSALSDSTNNVTVEAIVFNKVPALDINFFKEGFDPSISGSGHELVCEVCGKSVKECVKDGNGCSECKCNSEEVCCDACAKYIAALNPDNKPIVQMIRETLAKWYYILFVLSLIAMLVILIFTGIKMAISNTASEKANYKRMLVDWVVGLVIVFGIHYIMLFTITINESLVEVVHTASNELNKENMKNLNLMTLSEKAGDADYSNSELEIKVYEEIRTRAYDPKLTVGLTGMIMYMTLVYFAIRYTIIYIKRYFTIIVLTLMGPPIGVSYAFQKVMHGKSPSYSKWLKEYIMNVIIQTVHALMYSIFISEALILSLDSVAGLIIALVFLNYTSKADKLFRAIFKMGGGGSFLDDAMKAGDPESMKEPFNAVKGFVKADATKELAKTLVNSPYAKAVKAVGKTGLAGIGAAATGIAVGAKKVAEPVTNKLSNAVDNLSQKIYTNHPDANKRTIVGLPIRLMRKMRTPKKNLDLAVANAGKAVMNATNDQEQARAIKDYQRLKDEQDRRENTVISPPNAFKVAAARFTRSVDVRNTFNVSRYQTFGENAKAVYQGIFGTKHIDPVTGAKVSNKDGYFSQFSFDNLTGITGDEKTKLKDLMKNAGSGLVGLTGLYFGPFMCVAHPKLGFALLASGHTKFKKQFGLRAPKISDYKARKTYTFNSFSNGAIDNMTETVRRNSRRELETATPSDVENFRTNDDRRQKENSARARFSSIISLKTLSSKLEQIRKNSKAKFADLKKNRRKLSPPRLKVNSIDELNQKLGIPNDSNARDGKVIFDDRSVVKARNPRTNLGARYAEFMEMAEENKDKSFAEVREDYEARIAQFAEQAETTKAMQALLQIERTRKNATKKRRMEMQADALKAEYSKLGFTYDAQTGRLTRNTDGSTHKEQGKPNVNKHDLKVQESTKGIRNTVNVEKINRSLDKAIMQVSKGKELDVTDENTRNKIIAQLAENLRKEGVLSDKQDVKSLFKKGKLQDNIKQKTAYSNVKNMTLDKFLEKSLSKKDSKAVKMAIFGIDVKSGDSSKENISDLTPEEVFEKMKIISAHLSDGSKIPDLKVTSKAREEYTAEERKTIEVIEKYLKAVKDEKGEYAQLAEELNSKNPFIVRPENLPEALSKEEREALSYTTEVSATAINTKKAGRSYNKEELLRMKVEIKAALYDVSGGEDIDISNRKTRKQIFETITARFQDAGLITEAQTAEEIFQKGKLDNIVHEELQITNTKNSILEQYLSSTLSDEEAAGVKAAAAVLGEETKFLTSEQLTERVYERMRETLSKDEENERRTEIFNEELEAYGYVYDEETHRIEVKTSKEPITEEKDKYDQLLIEAYLEQGLTYNPEDGSVSSVENESKKNSEVEPELEVVSESRELNSADWALIHSEIDAIIMQLAAGETIDFNSEKTLDEIRRLLSNRLGAAGLLLDDETITSLFTKGSVDKVIKNRITKANIKIEASQKYLEGTLTSQEVTDVVSALSKLSKEAKGEKTISTEEVFQELEASGKMFGEDKSTSRHTDPTNPGEDTFMVPTREEKMSAVDQFLSGMQEETIKAQAIREVSQNTEARVQEVREADKIEKLPIIDSYLKAKNEDQELAEVSKTVSENIERNVESFEAEVSTAEEKSKRKIDQILASGLDEFLDSEHGNTLQAFLEQVDSVSETGGEVTTSSGEKVTLSATEAKESVSTLKVAERMIVENRKASKKKQVKHLTAIDVLEAELRVEREETRRRTIVENQGENSQAAKDAAELVAKRKKDMEIVKDLASKKEALSGPLFDIKSVLLGRKRG